MMELAFQSLNVDASARIGRQLAVNHDCRNGSNTQLLSSCEAPSVLHATHDDFGRTHLSLHFVNDLLAEGASRTEYFHLVSPTIHSITLLPISGLEYGPTGTLLGFNNV